jgi:hypothetical protein
MFVLPGRNNRPCINEENTEKNFFSLLNKNYKIDGFLMSETS